MQFRFAIFAFLALLAQTKCWAADPLSKLEPDALLHIRVSVYGVPKLEFSGFFVDPHGTFVTSARLVESFLSGLGADAIQVTLSNGRVFNEKQIQLKNLSNSEDLGICVLSIPFESRKFLRFAGGELKTNDAVIQPQFTAGNPTSTESLSAEPIGPHSPREFGISDLEASETNLPHFLEYRPKGGHFLLGSPIYTSDFKVAGILTWSFVSQAQIQNLALTSEDVKRFLAESQQQNAANLVSVREYNFLQAKKEDAEAYHDIVEPALKSLNTGGSLDSSFWERKQFQIDSYEWSISVPRNSVCTKLRLRKSREQVLSCDWPRLGGLAIVTHPSSGNKIIPAKEMNDLIPQNLGFYSAAQKSAEWPKILAGLTPANKKMMATIPRPMTCSDDKTLAGQFGNTSRCDYGVFNTPAEGNDTDITLIQTKGYRIGLGILAVSLHGQNRKYVSGIKEVALRTLKLTDKNVQTLRTPAADQYK